MKRLYKNFKNKISNKKGASNLEVIIIMAVALVIGGALFLLGNTLRQAASTANQHSQGMATAINGANFNTLKN